MIHYQDIFQAIRDSIRTVFSQTKVPYKKHAQFSVLCSLAEQTSLIEAIEIFYPQDKSMIGHCRPRFIKGYKDTFFDRYDWACKNLKEVIEFKHRPFITYDDLCAIERVPHSTSYLKEIREIFMAILERGKDAGALWQMNSGPITNGGTGDRAKNIEIFHQSIIDEAQKGATMMNQLIFQEFFGELHNKCGDEFTKTYSPILEEVYVPVIESGLLDRLRMNKGWETSKGAVREHQVALDVNLTLLYEEKSLVAA